MTMSFMHTEQHSSSLSTALEGAVQLSKQMSITSLNVTEDL